MKIRKTMAMLLAGCLTFQAWPAAVPVYGAKPIVGAALAEGTKGYLEVEVRSSQLFPYPGQVTVQISDGEKKTETQILIFGSSDSAKTALFPVTDGDYTVTVQSDKFADYTQTVRAEEGWITKISVSPERMEPGSAAAPGWFRIGDVNGDWQVDQRDIDALLAAIRQNTQDARADLNGDGAVDMMDLQYAVQSLDENQESCIERLGLARGIQAVNGTTIDGSMDDFLKNGKAITLKPQNANALISENNPVSLGFTLADGNSAAVPLEGLCIQTSVFTDAQGTICSEIDRGTVSVVYMDESGAERTTVFPLSSAAVPALMKATAAVSLVRASGGGVQIDAEGKLILDFGTRLAVKRVTITITGTKKTEPLVNIAKVEFVGDMANRIPAPQLDIPSIKEVVSLDKALTVSWYPRTNVTGYEICVSGPVKGQSKPETQIVRVSGTTHSVSSINGKSLLNFNKYTIKVRSVNDDWSSPWSEERIGEPKPQSLPAPVDNVRAQGAYRSINVTWKNMDDADGYMLYYKKTQDNSAGYRPVVEGFVQTASGEGKLGVTRYLISGLEDGVEYSVYVVGWNTLGWGRPSLISLATTKSIETPKLPNYKLLNRPKGAGVVSEHIVNAWIGGSGGARMIGSALDKDYAKSGLGLVDNDYSSYWMKEDWDDGISYPAADKGMWVALDNEYQMNYITFAAANDMVPLERVRIGYWNAGNPSTEQTVGARLLEKKDSHNRSYYIVKFDRTITANQIRINLGRTYSRAAMMVGEIHFHMYDSLEDDIMSLYDDEMHTTLKAGVTAETILALKARLETPDPVSGERHPLYNELALELKTAEEILNANLSPAYVVDNRITAKKDGHLGFGGLNAWQPLGKVAYTGETLIIYVGHNTKRTGDAADLQLVVTQHHAEASAFARTVRLKVGRNEITVPQIMSSAFEWGGQLYVAYTGNSAADRYAVRISGGSDIPALNIYKKSREERTKAIQAYVEELERYVGTIPAKHEELHKGTKHVNYDYDQTNCILNATDLMLDEMMYSLPATQVWAGIKNAGDKAAKLDQALQAMDDAMTLLYQHKGLSDEAGNVRGNNARPSQHLNIRYMRMFAGAFMYASGNHIGIEWGSATVAGAPKDLSGFGWGIGHEIGHNINQGSYAVAEVTNNYFAYLLTGKRRFTYENVYSKVTSGSVGRSSNVFTQLALYWQLHLAFDDQTDDRHIYDNYEEQFQNLFFARVDTYARNPDKAPQPGLTLNGGSEQNLMRLACAAANKNILPFFIRWGMTPDEATTAYAGKYAAEEKALYYVNDDARNYRVSHPGEKNTIKNTDAIRDVSAAAKSNRAEITIAANVDADLILGYEISRSMTSNGKKTTQIIGFIPIDTAESTVFTDTISTVNNRVMEYEVRAVDKYLNYSNAKPAGSVKIETGGVLNKELWTVETTMESGDDTAVDPDAEDPDNGYYENGSAGAEAKTVNSIERILDNDREAGGTYHGICGGTGVITIDMHKTEEVTSLKYQGDAIGRITVEVSGDGVTWTTVKENYADLAAGEEQTIWFDSVNASERKAWIGTYSARFVRLTIAQTGTVAIQEIDLCGPSGDNLEFLTAENEIPAVGLLTEDYKYGDNPEDVIPKDSLVFTGTYKGNPAYNVVLLYDLEGNVIGAKDGNVLSKQVLFAEVPEKGNLGETSDGRWVYYVEKEHLDLNALKNIGGVRGELYRVDNALTLEGERIVSDTQIIQIPDVLPGITLQGGHYEKMD